MGSVRTRGHFNPPSFYHSTHQINTVLFFILLKRLYGMFRRSVKVGLRKHIGGGEVNVNYHCKQRSGLRLIKANTR